MFDFLFHFLQAHSTPDGYMMMAPIVAGLLVLLGLMAIFVTVATIQQKAKEEGIKEGTELGIRKGIEIGEMNILTADAGELVD